MTNSSWKDTAELVGIAAIVASLVFVGIQVRQSQSSANVDQVASYGEMMLELRLSIVEHADVWQRACAGEELDSAESIQATQLFRAFMEFTYTQAIAADVGMFDYGPLLADRLAANFHRYPGLAKMRRALGEWTELGEQQGSVAEVSAFGAMVRGRIAELQELEPNPDFDIALCGM